ncbi:MAG: oligosaccharide flippase family protein [Crocinitomicaceae bacterium]|nr:oligosaccharide flippase family protein [Crocinitomicaceae bacterium]
MNPLKKLAGQTAIYGLSSIVGRLLNYFMVPLYTRFFDPEAYGVVGELYAYVGFLVVLLTFGMETTFFRFSHIEGNNKQNIYNQAGTFIIVVNVIFLLFSIGFSQSIANFIDYPEHREYVIWFALIVVTDAVSAIPLAKLRLEDKARQFAMVQLVTIGVNVALNLFFILFCKGLYDSGNSFFLIDWIYYPSIGVGYVFIANLLSSLVRPILLYKEFKAIQFKIDKPVMREMFLYAFPLVIAGFAGIINEVLDRILLRRILTASHGRSYSLEQVGIYSACYKLSIMITIFIQAFRYAAEPFFFSKSKDENHKKIYSRVMTYFVITVSLIFLLVSLYLDIFKYFIPNEKYWEGLKIVPILLLANIFLGIYYNQSIWYKLANKTKFGSYISMGGAILTIVLNVSLIPWIGYMGAAIATLVVYFAQMVASWKLGQIHYPIKYNIRKVIFYLLLAILLYLISLIFNFDSIFVKLLVNTILLSLFIFVVFILENPLKLIQKR